MKWDYVEFNRNDLRGSAGKSATVNKWAESGNITNHTEAPLMPNISTFFPSRSGLRKKLKLSPGEFWKDLTHMFSITSLWPTLSVWYFLHQFFPPPIYSVFALRNLVNPPSTTGLSLNSSLISTGMWPFASGWKIPSFCFGQCGSALGLEVLEFINPAVKTRWWYSHLHVVRDLFGSCHVNSSSSCYLEFLM